MSRPLLAVDIDGVISTPDAPSIYDIPKVLHREELDAYVVRRLNLPFRDVDWTEWDDLLRRVHEPHETVRIALVGKYVELSDAYLRAKADAENTRRRAEEEMGKARKFAVESFAEGPST